jgi:hypothetical protein
MSFSPRQLQRNEELKFGQNKMTKYREETNSSHDDAKKETGKESRDRDANHQQKPLWYQRKNILNTYIHKYIYTYILHMFHRSNCSHKTAEYETSHDYITNNTYKK